MSSSSAAALAPRSGAAPAVAGDARPSLDAVAFDAVVTPHEPLSGRGLLVLSVVLASVSLAFQAGFALAGIWLASVFLFADTALLLFAFAIYRVAQRRSERVVVDGATVRVERTGPRGPTETTVWSAWGLAVEVETDPDYGCRSITLAHRGRREEIARDLSPGERAAFLAAFTDALQQTGFPPRVETRTAPPLRFS